MAHKWLSGLATLAACGGAPPPRDVPVTLPGKLVPSELAAWVDRELGPRVPSAVVGLVDRRGLLWSHGVGARDPRTPGRPDRTTVYRIGSVTKLVTGTAVLQLRDRGKLALSDKLARWIPEVPALADVTLHHLVTHTAGIPSIGDGSAVYWETSPPDRTALLRSVSGALAFAPGTKSEYSNAGMAIAGEVVARASGGSYRDHVAKHVFAPLGMRDIAWSRDAVPVERLAIGQAHGKVDPPHWQLGAFEPAGGLYASLDDLAAFARFALGTHPEVLAPATLAEAQRRTSLPGPHGIAWLVGSSGDERFAAHTGSTMDYSASLVVLPERGLAVITLAAGPDAELVECSAATIARAAGTGAALAPCRAPIDATTRSATTAALDALLAVLANPTQLAIEAAFDPAFLQQIPVATIASMVAELRGRVGACTRYELRERGGMGARGELVCERGTLKFELATTDAAPFRITGILFPEL